MQKSCAPGDAVADAQFKGLESQVSRWMKAASWRFFSGGASFFFIFFVFFFLGGVGGFGGFGNLWSLGSTVVMRPGMEDSP